jgi:hypothetical protein
MLSHKLVHLIEEHSEVLATKLLEKVERSPSTRTYSRVPPQELKERVSEIYRHLGLWLLRKPDAELRQLYHEIGARRFHQQVALADMVWAIVLAKQNLWEFLDSEGIPERMTEVFGELDLLQMLGGFFDRAIHYAVAGYDEARALNFAPRRIAVDG